MKAHSKYLIAIAVILNFAGAAFAGLPTGGGTYFGPIGDRNGWVANNGVDPTASIYATQTAVTPSFALTGSYATRDASDYGVNLQFGDASDSKMTTWAVAQLQAALRKRGYYQGPISGILGPYTSQAIAAYQRDDNLPVTGTVTDATLRSLNLD